MEANNITAMREALKKIEKLNHFDLGCIRSKRRRDEFDARILEIEKTVRAALATPARNCDVGAPAEAHMAFQRFCRGNYRPGYAAAGLDGCDDCELCEVKNKNGEDACPFWWLLAPAKPETKGDANAI